MDLSLYLSLDLPSNNPADAMTFYKHIEGDTFRRIRDDDELGETVTFDGCVSCFTFTEWNFGGLTLLVITTLESLE